MPAIRANSVLPARREAITLHTADGLSLAGAALLRLAAGRAAGQRKPQRNAEIPVSA